MMKGGEAGLFGYEDEREISCLKRDREVILAKKKIKNHFRTCDNDRLATEVAIRIRQFFELPFEKLAA
jgi:hypothetical protein